MSCVPYGFVITRDHKDCANRRRLGPANTGLTSDEIIAHGVPFRLLDDKRTLCYEGMFCGRDNESKFSPLDDFGEKVAGCSIIQYPDNATGTWADL